MSPSWTCRGRRWARRPDRGLARAGCQQLPLAARGGTVGRAGASGDRAGPAGPWPLRQRSRDYSLGTLASSVRDLLDHLGLATCAGRPLDGRWDRAAVRLPVPAAAGCCGAVGRGRPGDRTSSALRWLARPGSGLVLAAAFNSATVGALEAAARRWPLGGRRAARPAVGRVAGALPRARRSGPPGGFPEHAAVSGRRWWPARVGRRAPVRAGRHADLDRLGRPRPHPAVAHGDRAHAALPHSTLVVLPEAGHDPHLDAPG